MPVIGKIGENQGLEIYLQYDRLSAKTLAVLVGELDGLYNDLPDISLNYYLERGGPGRRYLGWTSPRLEIESVATGNSIEFKFKDGWRPRYSTKRGNLVVELPTRPALVILLLYYLLGAVAEGFDGVSKYYDAKIKKAEYEQLLEKQEQCKREVLRDSDFVFVEDTNEKGLKEKARVFLAKVSSLDGVKLMKINGIVAVQNNDETQREEVEGSD